MGAREARERSTPFVAVGIPRFDVERYAVIVPLKNLGLGPARLITLQIKEGERVVSARISPGLAPMESSDWVMFIVDREPPAPLLSLDDLSFEGLAEDASGARHPLRLFGGDLILDYPSFDPAAQDPPREVGEGGRGG